jgi:heme/copper-type cytochrome/quinol oxidase subunit 3
VAKFSYKKKRWNQLFQKHQESTAFMIEPAKNRQLENQFFEFFFEKTGFFGTHVSLSIPGLITRRYLWQILITAAQWAVARKQRPIHVASQQVTTLFPIS